MPYLVFPKVPPHGLTGPGSVATSRAVLRPSKVLLSALLAAATAFAKNPPTSNVPRPGNPPVTPAPGTPVETPAPGPPAVTPLPGTPVAAASTSPDVLEPLQFPN